MEYKTIFVRYVLLELWYLIFMPVTWLYKIRNKSLGVHFQTLFLLRFWISIMRAFQRYTTWSYFERKKRIPIWCQIKCDVILIFLFFFKIGSCCIPMESSRHGDSLSKKEYSLKMKSWRLISDFLKSRDQLKNEVS